MRAEGKNFLEHNVQNWNGRTWDEISVEYRAAIKSLLSSLDKRLHYEELAQDSLAGYDYPGVHPDLIKVALDFLDDNDWKRWCEKYILPYDVKEYERATDRHIDSEKKMEFLRIALIGIVAKKTGSVKSEFNSSNDDDDDNNDSKNLNSDETAPVIMMREFYKWRETFSKREVIDSIYNTGYMPDDYKMKDDASPKEDIGLKWKANDGLVAEVNKFILQSYPGGLEQAAEDFNEYAEFILPILRDLQGRLAFSAIQNKNAVTQKVVTNIEDAFKDAGVTLKNPTRKQMDDIFLLKTGTKQYANVPLLDMDGAKKVEPVFLKVIYYLYENFDFVKYMVNYTKYKCKIDFTRRNFGEIGRVLGEDEYMIYLKNILDFTDQMISTTVTRLDSETRKITGKKINIHDISGIYDVCYLNVFKLVQCMVVEANKYQENIGMYKRKTTI